MKWSDDRVVLFDIDRTLLDTDLFWERMMEFHVKNLELAKREIYLIVDKYISQLESGYHFDYLELAGLLAVNKEELTMLMNNYETNRVMYPRFEDVQPTMEWLKSAGVKVGIFSEGKPHFQRNKLVNLQLNDYINLELVFIALSKRTEDFLKLIPEEAVIVDDNPEVIGMLVERGRSRPVFLNRKSEEVHPRAVMIHSLKELKELNWGVDF